MWCQANEVTKSGVKEEADTQYCCCGKSSLPPLKVVWIYFYQVLLAPHITSGCARRTTLLSAADLTILACYHMHSQSESHTTTVNTPPTTRSCVRHTTLPSAAATSIPTPHGCGPRQRPAWRWEVRRYCVGMSSIPDSNVLVMASTRPQRLCCLLLTGYLL